MDSIINMQTVVSADKYMELAEKCRAQQEEINNLYREQVEQYRRMNESLATIAYVGLVDADVFPGSTLDWLEDIRGYNLFDEDEI